MIGRRGPPSQSWRTFLRNHADAIAAIDLCVVPTQPRSARPARAAGRLGSGLLMPLSLHERLTMLMPPSVFYRQRIAQEARTGEPELAVLAELVPRGGIAVDVGANVGFFTGQVANTNTSSFPVGNGGDGASAHFIFANLNGTISAWDMGQNAFTQVTTPNASYTGLAINQAQTRLYAANGAGSGSIDVFNSSFTQVPLVTLGPNAFATPSQVPTGFVPFNVQNINGNVYVTYAPPDVQPRQRPLPAWGRWRFSMRTEPSCGWPPSAAHSRRRGALLSPRPVSVRLAATC